MLRRVGLVRTDVSEDRSTSIIRVTRIGELGMLAVNSNRRTQRRNTLSPLSLWWKRYVPPKRRLLQEPHGVISQKTAFFIAIAVQTSNLTIWIQFHTLISRGRGFETRWGEWFLSSYLILPVALGTGVYSASNRNEYQKHKNNVSGE
jgi:hypothetical protein